MKTKTLIIAVAAVAVAKFGVQLSDATTHQHYTCDVQRFAPPGRDGGEETPRETTSSAHITLGRYSEIGLPYDEYEHPAPELNRALNEWDGHRAGGDDSQTLIASEDGFDYWDGPGVHRSRFALFNCQEDRA